MPFENIFMLSFRIFLFEAKKNSQFVKKIHGNTLSVKLEDDSKNTF